MNITILSSNVNNVIINVKSNVMADKDVVIAMADADKIIADKMKVCTI